MTCPHATIAIARASYVPATPATPGHYVAVARCHDCTKRLACETHATSEQTARDLAALAARRVTQEAAG